MLVLPARLALNRGVLDCIYDLIIFTINFIGIPPVALVSDSKVHDTPTSHIGEKKSFSQLAGCDIIPTKARINLLVCDTIQPP